MSKNFFAVAIMFFGMTAFLVGCGNKATTSTTTNMDGDHMQESMADNDSTMKDSKDTMHDEDDTLMMDDENQMMGEGDDSMMEAGDKMDKEGMSTDGGAMMASNDYMIASGTTASYIVQKGWLNKPTEEVVGSTSSVTGTFSYDAQADTVSDLKVTIDSQTFDSGAGGRDKYVQDLFDGPITVMSTETMKSVDGSFDTTVPMTLTINGTSKKLDFKVSGTATENSLTAKGSASFKLSDFGIDPPSAVGVYNVADEMAVSFNLKSAAK